ncbi:MAG: hypothetical protein ACTSR4_06070 [Candidatus Hodarchaeales archaeon]
MSRNNANFSERIKASIKRIVDKEVDSLYKYEKEYKISSHPIKRAFATISRLNKLHSGRIAIAEIAKEAKLSEADIILIIQELTAQRLFDSIIEDNYLILKQDTYLCQIDQTSHSIFDLHFQCTRCLRFICSACYQSAHSDICPYCKGDFIPVPRIFKKTDVTSVVDPKGAKSSLTDYYKKKRAKASNKGIKAASTDIIGDLKSLNKRRWSLSDMKDNTKTFLDYRKQERDIEKHKKAIKDTIAWIHEIEEEKQISLQRIAKITKLDVSMVNTILSYLIEQQLIQGFLETSGTFDTVSDDFLVLGSDKIYCHLHEGELSISAPHHQCLTCFRIVCADCYSSMEAGGMKSCISCGGEMQSHSL